MNTGKGIEAVVAKDIQIGEQALHMEVSGRGKPLVLMHGWGCSSFTVRSIAKVAADVRTVYNLDMPGFGASPEPPEVWGVEQYADLVLNFCRQEGLESPILVGHSFGGRVAIKLAAESDLNPEAIILVDAAGIKPRRSWKYYFKVWSFKAEKNLVNLVLSREKAEKVIERMRARRGSSDYANSSPRMKAILSRVVNEDLTPLLTAIHCPALLIWGEKDTATPLSDAKLMASRIPDAGLVSFPGCGHYSFLDNPGQFAAVIKSFLSSMAAKNRD